MAIRTELEAAIELEAKKSKQAIGWNTDAVIMKDDETGEPLGFTRVTVTNDAGFSKTVDVPDSEGKTPRELCDEFHEPTIAEVETRFKAKKIEAKPIVK